jgi:3-deoxy-D-manno-octulosonic-acid transferase
VIHQYAPVDLEAAVRRFVEHWHPSAGLLLESEFWPTLLHRTRAAGCALAVVNGRISPASYHSWRRLMPVIRSLLDPFELILAQSPEDRAHFEALGARRVECLGNLKFAGPPLAADPDAIAALQAAIGERPLWLAASTHPGEDEIAAEVHAKLAPAHPGLLTLIAPRHPERGETIAAMLRGRGLAVARRAASEVPGRETAIYIADTIGEMGLWYRLAGIAFVGGSLVPHGGQNPLEPAKLGCAILCGPHTGNFRQVTREMIASCAQRPVADAAALADAVGTLLGDPAASETMAEAARRYAETQAGVLDAVVRALAPMLDRAAGKAPPRG